MPECALLQVARLADTSMMSGWQQQGVALLGPLKFTS